MKRRLRGFTLVEVLAALGIIIVLTLSLVLTVKAQVDRANTQHLTALVAVVNSQIAVAYEGADFAKIDFTTTAGLLQGNVVTAEQWQELSEKAIFVKGSPPTFEVK